MYNNVWNSALASDHGWSQIATWAWGCHGGSGCDDPENIEDAICGDGVATFGGQPCSCCEAGTNPSSYVLLDSFALPVSVSGYFFFLRFFCS